MAGIFHNLEKEIDIQIQVSQKFQMKSTKGDPHEGTI